MNGPFLLLTLSVLASLVTLGFYAVRAAGPIAFIPLFIVIAWIVIMLTDAQCE